VLTAGRAGVVCGALAGRGEGRPAALLGGNFGGVLEDVVDGDEFGAGALGKGTRGWGAVASVCDLDGMLDYRRIGGSRGRGVGTYKDGGTPLAFRGGSTHCGYGWRDLESGSEGVIEETTLMERGLLLLWGLKLRC
jgi:hypothetical protein